MERNVWSFYIAIDMGYEPRLYPFNPDGITAGEYIAHLDFKIWSKKTMAVVCYFSISQIEIKCCLSVFRSRIDQEYILPGGDIDFTTSPTNKKYRIAISYNCKNNPVLKEAKLIDDEKED